MGANLGLGIILLLLVTPDDGPPLVGVVQVGGAVADDAGGAGVDERVDAGVAARVDDGLGPPHVDLVEELAGLLVVDGDGGGGVDDDVGLELLEYRRQAGGVGDVALAVDGGRVAVAVAAQVHRRHVRAGPRLQRLVDDVVAQEAVAANDEHAAQLTALLFRRRHWGGRFAVCAWVRGCVCVCVCARFIFFSASSFLVSGDYSRKKCKLGRYFGCMRRFLRFLRWR